jgi:heme/copper-type cytochrome/quinol oxidase subunit 2
MQLTEILIVVGVAFIVAIAVRVFRARRAARNRGPAHIHEALMKRAELHTERSPFLKKVVSEFKANGHVSNRQAEAVAKALKRFEGK